MRRPVSPDLLGPDLAALIEEQPSPLVAARVVTGLPAKRLLRQTFCLTFADGTRLKGRRLDRAEDAERIERLTAKLDANLFSRPIARRGTALLEPWIEGIRLDRLAANTRLMRQCGSLLGAIHATSVEPNGEDGRWRPDARLANVEGRLERLARERLLSRRARGTLIAVARDQMPRRPKTGLLHRDLSPRNIVVDATGIARAVDNGSISLGAYGFDLARTAYLWPMRAAESRAFRSGYREAVGAVPRHSAFWTIDVLSDVALFRLLNGVHGVGRPLDMLRRMADRS